MKVNIWRRQKTRLFRKRVYHHKTTHPHKVVIRILSLLRISNKRRVRVRIVMVWGVVWMEVVTVEVEMVKEEREVVGVVMERGVVRVKGVVRMTPTLQTHRWTLIWFCYPLLLAIWTTLKEMGESKLISLKFPRLFMIYSSYSILEAVCKLLAKYPTDQQVFKESCNAVLTLKDSLPLEVTDTLRQVHINALAAIAQFDLLHGNMGVIDCTINFLILLWNIYPKELSAECNVGHLSNLLNAGLDIQAHGQKMGALQVGNDFVGFMMQQLSDQQLVELEDGGVGNKLRSLLSYYEDMSPDMLKQIVVGVGMLAEVKVNVQEFVKDNCHVSLLFAAEKHASHSVIQDLIWRVLSLIVQKDASFVRELTTCGVLPAIATIMQREGFTLLPIVRFMTLCCHNAPEPFLQQLLENTELMQALLKVVDPETNHTLERVAQTCDFLAYVCSKAPPSHIGHVVDLGVVSQIEMCARKWPKACILQACIAIEGFCMPHPPRVLGQQDTTQKKLEFFSLNHHLFAKEMLCDPVISENGGLVELIYVLIQKLLRASPPATLQSMCEKDFVETLVMLFARDTATFPQLANRIAFTMHYFVFQMKDKECFEHLKEYGLHSLVIDLIESSNSYDVTASSLGLLASLLSKYYNHFKDINMVLDTQLPELLVSKCMQYRHQRTPQFGDDFGRILLNITANKEMSLELHKRGYMDKLLDLLNEEVMPVTRRSIIHAIGNISLGSQHIKQELHEREFHETLLHILESISERTDAFVLSACCRVLHILATGDQAKRQFVERGCIPLLLRLLKSCQNNAKLHSEEVSWRSLSLLSSLGFIAVTNRRYVLTAEVVEAIAEILRNSKNGKVISYTVLVFLGVGEMDDGAAKLRELAVEEYLSRAMDKVVYKAQAPDLARWCGHVLEKQYLYTLLAPSDSTKPPPPLSPLTAREIDWPHQFNLPDSTMEIDGNEESNKIPKLLPLEEAYVTPQYPVAPELSCAAQQQLRELGLDPDQPLFRLGRVYGSTHGFCSNCEKESFSEELVIRPHSLTPHQYQDLIDYGWYRRGGVKMFRLRSNHNVYHVDWETQVDVLKFDQRSHKSYGRVLKKMPKDRLTVETLPTHFNREAFDLYNAYHIDKHDKPLKSMFSYTEHVVNSPLQPQTIDGVEYGTFHQLYRLDGKLVAIGIIDVVPKGIVSIYMWYDISKAISKYSFGVYSALKEIELVCQYHKRNPNMQYYYLQGWNKLNKKLAYKSNYGPGYFYCPTIVGEWVEGEDGVERSQEAYVQKKKEEEQENKGQKEGGPGVNRDEGTPPDTGESKDATVVAATNSSSNDQNDRSQDMDTTDGDTDKQQETAKKEPNCNDVKDKDKDTEDKSDDPGYACEAYPQDLARYTARTGETTVDVRKIVVCLNYTEYCRLGDVIDSYQVPESQWKALEQRLSELVVSLSDSLLSQLVIDFKVCTRQHTPSSPIVMLESDDHVDTQ